jgi:hypothetical protein
MSVRENHISRQLTCAAGFAIAACVLLSGVVMAQKAPKVETVLTLPQETNGQTENITEGPDGSIYVTAAFDRILWKIKDGKAQKFFSSPSHAAISGVAWDKDELVVAALQKPPFAPRVEGQRGFALNRDIGSQALVVDKSGTVKATIAAHDPQQFFNGLARAGDHWYLITDTASSQVLSLDTKAKTISTWLQDPQLRTNGIKVNKGWVYLTSADKIYRVEIGPDRTPKGGAVLFAQGAPTDDFGVAPDGTLYLPSGKTIVRVTPSGQSSVFLDEIETENSPAAWVTRDGKWLYWTERAGPAKVKRVALK